MSFRVTALRQSHTVLFLLALIAAQPAFGQLATSPIAFAERDAITVSFVAAPNVGGNSGTTPGATDQWLKVEFHYGTTKNLLTPYLDAAEFKVWIEGFDPLATNAQGSKGIGVAFTGSVTYVNIAAGKDIYGVFYVHPSTLGRFSSRSTDYERKYDIHMQALVGGAVMDEINKNKETDILGWYKPLTVIPNLVYRQDQSPFLMADTSRYPAIKLPAAAQ
jgi:hypothetical protein